LYKTKKQSTRDVTVAMFVACMRLVDKNICLAGSTCKNSSDGSSEAATKWSPKLSKAGRLCGGAHKKSGNLNSTRVLSGYGHH